MKHLDRSRSPRSGFLEPVLALLVCVAILFFSLTPSVLAGGGSTCRQPPPKTGADMSYDEGIGSLPLEQAPDPYAPISDLVSAQYLGPMGLVRPYIYLRGNLDDLGRAIRDARGDGVATLHPPALPGDLWVLGFHGDVDVDFDAGELRKGYVEVSVRVGGEFEGGLAAVSWNGLSTPAVVLDQPLLALPMSQWIDSGFFHKSDMGFTALSAFDTVAQLGIELLLHSGTLRFVQRID